MDATPERTAQTTSCKACGDGIPDGARMCKTCKFPKADVANCVNCRRLIPHDAPYCNECKTYQNLRLFSVSATVVALFAAFIGVVSAVIPAFSYVLEYNSDTSFRVTSADATHIYVKVWNTGHKPSTLVGYQLKFDERLPIQSTQLQLGDDDIKEGRSVVASGAPVKVSLVAGDRSLNLIPKRNGGQYTKNDIDGLLTSQLVVLQIDVEESNDPGAGFWPFLASHQRHVMRQSFSVARVKPFILWTMTKEKDEPQD